jgi:hypothetical protein
MQEMLHLGLAGNILTSIGGSPLLYGKDYTPTFPSTFYDTKLKIELRPATKENIHSFAEVSRFILLTTH